MKFPQAGLQETTVKNCGALGATHYSRLPLESQKGKLPCPRWCDGYSHYIKHCTASMLVHASEHSTEAGGLQV